jgi:hypothetical protein
VTRALVLAQVQVPLVRAPVRLPPETPARQMAPKK